MPRVTFPSSSRVLSLLALAWFLIAGLAHAQTWGSPVGQDEFNGALNSPIDSTKWTYDTGNLMVNNELEIYCAPSSSTAPCDNTNPNAFIDGAGHLVIQQRLNGSTWTSARLKTQGLQTFQYGRIESSLEIPSHIGLWPAFWMLGSNIDTVSWPACGEVDIMENWPALGAAKNATSMHGPGYSGGSSLTSQFVFPGSERIDTAFHTYGIIWSPNMVQFYLDNPSNITFVRTAADTPSGSPWPFNNTFFLLTNMAVGGLGGTPDNGTPTAAPAMMLDYVRYYQAATIPGPAVTPASAITVSAGGSGSATLNLSSAIGSGLIYLACSGAPAKSTCSISTTNSLNSHVVDFTSSATATATVHITTTANTAQVIPSHRFMWASFIGVGGFVILPLASLVKSNGRVRLGAAILGLFVIAAALASCGGGSASNGGGGGMGGASNGTPAGSYTLTVTAYTVSGDTSTGSVTLNVN
jgi:beta-glucanase (GH16 family)